MYIKTSKQEELKLGIGYYTCNWSINICSLYENDEEHDEIILGFLGEENISGDLQLYCPAEQIKETFTKKFNKAYPNGGVLPFEMDKGLDQFYFGSQKDGHRNVRVTAEMAWALEAIPGIEHLMVYESSLNYFIPCKPWTSISLYNINKFSGATIKDVLRTHPYAISGGIIKQNPYYVNPDKWLAENAPQFLNV